MSVLLSDPEVANTSSQLARRLDFQDQTLAQVLRLQARLGDKVMIRTGTDQMTYRQAPEVAARSAQRLLNEGVEKGDRVVTFMSNRIEHVELWFGLAWIGATLVPLNTEFRGEQLQHALRSTRPKLIVTESALLECLLRDLPHDISASTPVVLIDAVDNETAKADSPVTYRRLNESWDTDSADIPAEEIRASEPAALLLTSGTTGPSKSVICPHAQFYWWGVLTGEALGLGQDDVLFTSLPFFHTNALNALWQAMLFGATYCFTARFSASRFWSQVRENDATVTYLLGAMAQILVNREPQPIDLDHTLRIALCPATPLDTVNEFDRRFGVTLVDGYGSTETNMVMANTIGGHAPASMGRVLDGFEVRIVDENDCDLAVGQAGELLVRHTEPYSMAAGYFDNAEATVNAWRNLWFHTGDRVYQCPDKGTYHFVDRIIDAIRRRGENISSWEVETALMHHPDIEVAAVFGVPSDLGSEEDVMTHVVAVTGQSIEIPEVIAYLENHLARFAIPRYWEIVESLPITENGKVRKHVLREQGVGPQTWDRTI